MTQNSVNTKSTVEKTAAEIIEEAMNDIPVAKELINKHVEATILERFVPRNTGTISEKLSEMEDSDEEDELEDKEETNELYVSDEDPDADQIDEETVEEDQVPTIAPADTNVELEPEMEPELEVEPEPSIDIEDLKMALKELLGLSSPEEEVPGEEEFGIDGLEPGIKHEQEEVDENASPTQDMDAPKQNEPNAELGTVKKSSPEAEQKPLKEEENVLEIEEEVVEENEEEVKNNSSSNFALTEMKKTIELLKSKNNSLVVENKALRQVVKSYKETLDENALDLTKLDLQSQLFEAYSVNNATKKKIMEKFETSKTIADANLIYETYKDALEVSGVNPIKRHVVKEATKQIGNTSAKNKIINEDVTSEVERMKYMVSYRSGQ